MNFIKDFIPENILNAFGWMIVHSVWQGALIAVLLSIVLLFLNHRSARIRYIVALGALLIFTSTAIRTFIEYYQTSEVHIETVSVKDNNKETNSDEKRSAA